MAPKLVHAFPKLGSGLLCLIPWFGFAGFLSLIPEISEGGVPTASFDWVPSLGVSLSFRVDGLSLMMALLILGIGGFIVPYAKGYLDGHPQLNRFMGYLLFFMGSMLGVVIADNLILLFIFWEMTSISSYLLIGFKHESDESRRNALQALLVTGIGGLALLAGLILIGLESGNWTLTEVLADSKKGLGGLPSFELIAVLLFLGAFTKSAQFPFHFWLPNAMAAPTPVSAYLHSATMVKAGVYLLARFSPPMAGEPLWHDTLTWIGAITMLVGAGLGLLQKDLKKILAYTTLSVLGILTFFIGLGSKKMMLAAILFLIGHALYKATLFMVAGSIDHSTGTRNVNQLRGLRKIMPWSAGAGLLAAFSMAGLPPFFGFLGKEYSYKGLLDIGSGMIIFLIIAMIANIVLMGLAFTAGLHPFWGNKSEASYPKEHAHEVSIWMLAGPIVLSVCGFLFGLLPHLIQEPIIGPAVASLIGKPYDHLELSLWHGFNLPLLLSGITISAGIFLYVIRKPIWSTIFSKEINWFGPEKIYFLVMDGILSLAKAVTLLLQGGKLRNYMFLTVGSIIGFVAIELFLTQEFMGSLTFENVSVHEASLVLVMAIAAVVSVVSKTRITTIIALGVVGFGVALLFAFFSAPDLAITQVLVETLVVVLFMFVIYRLPPFRNISPNAVKVVDALFCLGVGAVVTSLVLSAQEIQMQPSISDSFAQSSYMEAHGKNVVNVILVDFRALDTFGEITVIGIAALGVIALIQRIYTKKEEVEQ